VIVPRDPLVLITPEMWQALRVKYPDGALLAAAWQLAKDPDALADLLAGLPVSQGRLNQDALVEARRRTLVQLRAPIELVNVIEDEG
jgi:hypothetical protein